MRNIWWLTLIALSIILPGCGKSSTPRLDTYVFDLQFGDSKGVVSDKLENAGLNIPAFASLRFWDEHISIEEKFTLQGVVWNDLTCSFKDSGLYSVEFTTFHPLTYSQLANLFDFLRLNDFSGPVSDESCKDMVKFDKKPLSAIITSYGGMTQLCIFLDYKNGQ